MSTTDILALGPSVSAPHCPLLAVLVPVPVLVLEVVVPMLVLEVVVPMLVLEVVVAPR